MSDPIGSALRQAREEQQLTIVELARITRIPANSIRALEEGNFEVLPAPIFIRGFLKSVCREIDLDPSEILAMYDAYLHERELVEEEPKQPVGPILMSASDFSDPADRRLEISHVLLVLLAIVTFLIAYLTAGLPTSKTVDTAQSIPSTQAIHNQNR